ncbi:MAG: phage tail assembly protein [Burkholderiales bacterium]|nr:phage tail assembly protein [Burkholderiales bacterium]
MTDKNKEPPASKPAAGVKLHGNRTLEVPLDFPAEFDGVIYDKVTIRRPNAGEVAAFFNSLQEGNLPDLNLYDLPFDISELDDDDLRRVNEATEGFLPLSLRTVLAHFRQRGEDTSPSSQASSEAESESTN